MSVVTLNEIFNNIQIPVTLCASSQTNQSIFSWPVQMYSKTTCNGVSIGGSISKILKFYVKVVM